MTFLARLIRFLFWVVIVSWGVRLAGRLISGLLPPGRPREPLQPTADSNAEQSGRLLVRDPICGVHIAEVLAIPLRTNGQLLHFCSLTCRDAYLNSSHKLAANA
jgi:YHS domain-containing protein